MRLATLAVELEEVVVSFGLGLGLETPLRADGIDVILVVGFGAATAPILAPDSLVVIVGRLGRLCPSNFSFPLRCLRRVGFGMGEGGGSGGMPRKSEASSREYGFLDMALLRLLMDAFW